MYLYLAKKEGRKYSNVKKIIITKTILHNFCEYIFSFLQQNLPYFISDLATNLSNGFLFFSRNMSLQKIHYFFISLVHGQIQWGPTIIIWSIW